MEALSVDERCEIECGRIVKLLKENDGKLSLENLTEKYKEKYKIDLEQWKGAFVQFSTFIKYGCSGKIDIVNDDIVLTSKPKSGSSDAQSGSFQYISKPQFSQFYGFSDRDRGKGVPYRVWRFEVASTIKEGLYSNEIVAEQIRRSLQGEAKSKVVGFSVDTTMEDMLSQLDQFYMEDGGVTGDEMLAEAYKWKQGAQEEVAAFASRLDNEVRKAKVRGTALLPDEGAVDKQLRVLFWEGLKGPIKDKARHRKDQCQSFAELITAARYGEKEAYGSNEAKYVGRAQQSVVQEPGESAWSNADNPLKWFNQMLQEVKAMASTVEARQNEQSSEGGRRKPWGSRRSGGDPPTCFRCGQVGHQRIGCRNAPIDRNSTGGNTGRTPENGDRPLTRGSQRF